MAEKTSYSGGVGFFGLLGILFIGLKLTNYIDWSWWWVTAPLWAPFSLAVLIVLIVFSFYLYKFTKKEKK